MKYIKFRVSLPEKNTPSFAHIHIFKNIRDWIWFSVVKNIDPTAWREDGKNLTSDNLLLHAQFSGEVSGACSMFDAWVENAKMHQEAKKGLLRPTSSHFNLLL